MERIWIAIGSNFGKPLKQVNTALSELAKLPKTRFLACSSYYRSRPLGLQNQPDFLNAVAVLDTALTPEILLNYIQAIELKQGRVRKANRFGPRTLDLDILLFGMRTIVTPRLTIPHYDIYNREFFLYPLKELSPNLQFPNGVMLSYYLTQVPYNNLTYWNEDLSITTHIPIR
ncbi:2-amino-4-hydroxy-6-hydroxymethyldihydropteridinepyrophosphokinase [Candidatus Gullanella endobia]|uniref:2-amino-4-hydroxy-6-hydroxymethyldihydropteridine pyrophosphokinase n=1 Tax=Candidatus Gullanella endobia TaxID=1070130 RepID=A0A143WTY6_9ENTR|nr:2-amino-4-hydroxy-6-hydroxymethyldihydropteridine diphosphokinase [Candidatus Gullanella endobia]CUX96319.1 2-amino-4-hydroxy-6-hydroxymethyldihydropteridinepyrophosphokinase [Candidatus Gullanella endobia]